jgi:hypothetical protein
MIRHSSTGRLLLVAFMALTLFFQGYVTQSHFHTQNELTNTNVLKAGGAPGHDNNTPSDDPDNCPICQQLMHAGQFVAPTSLVYFSALLAISVIEIVTLAIPRFDAISHSWRGRGPPHI